MIKMVNGCHMSRATGEPIRPYHTARATHEEGVVVKEGMYGGAATRHTPSEKP